MNPRILHRLPATTLLLCTSLLLGTPALAQTQPSSPYDVNVAADVPITLGALTLSFLLRWVPIRDAEPRETEVLGFDQSVRANFSSSANKVSDMTLWGSLVLPPSVLLGRGANQRFAEAMLIYGEVFALNNLLTRAVKVAVQRPRPYTHSDDEQISAYSAERERNGRMSFFSGHSSTAFSAAVAGSYLYAAASSDETSRAILWGTSLSLASGTAVMRVRAGKHYVSDVVVGAMVGSGLGLGVSILHASRPSSFRLTRAEGLSIAGGVLGGIALGAFLPVKDDIRLPLDASEDTQARVVPWILPDGGGLLFAWQ